MLTRWHAPFLEEKIQEQRLLENYSFEHPSKTIECLINDKEHFLAKVNLSDRDP